MREEIMQIMKKVNKTGKYSQYQTERQSKKFMERDASIVHLEQTAATPEMYINNSYTPIMGADYEQFMKKKHIDLHRQSINSNLTTNIGETHDINS